MIHQIRLTINKKILLALLMFFILNAVDGVLTLWGLNLDLIEEANPGMRLLMAKSPIGFMTFKLSLPVIFGYYPGGSGTDRLS